MGQRVKTPRLQNQIGGGACLTAEPLNLSVFLTDFGWFGLLGRDEKIWRLTIGHVSSDGVREALARRDDGERSEEGGATTAAGGRGDSLEESDWLPDVRRRLERYAAGELVDFGDCELDTPPRTLFQERVFEVTRGIPFGETVTYGQLAEMAGAPRAARAVGSVMASNRVPIIIPCHRVVAAGAKLGGFSAPSGVRLKEQMLGMEAAAVV